MAAQKAKDALSSLSEENSGEEKEEEISPPSLEWVEGEERPMATEGEQPKLRVGARASGKWKGPQHKGTWYPGVIKSINFKKHTVHITYDDDDEDKNLSWSNLMLT